jgi:hypothetical protein
VSSMTGPGVEGGAAISGSESNLRSGVEARERAGREGRLGLYHGSTKFIITPTLTSSQVQHHEIQRA